MLKTMPDFENGKILYADVLVFKHGLTIRWNVETVGFGEITFYRDKEGVLHCQHECMGKEFVKRILCHVVDEARLED